MDRIGISTAGIVNYAGTEVTIAAPHLAALTNATWTEYLKDKFKAPVVIINDADAVAIGASVKGYLHCDGTIGVMPVGTGIGFSLWRNGRRWRPGQELPLLGSIMTPSGTFDQIAGVATLKDKTLGQPEKVFTDAALALLREEYTNRLAEVIYSACVIYNVTKILLGGGLAEIIGNYPLANALQEKVNTSLAFLKKQINVQIMPEGNILPLIGACLLAVNEQAARKNSRRKEYNSIETEIPYNDSLQLQSMQSNEIVRLLYEAENEAGDNLGSSLEDISAVAARIADALAKDGRLIYVGAGTSGRLAAIDTVEIACTFGFPRDRVLTLIAGGLADAAIDIETGFEEDASAVPEILLTNLQPNDVVVGISVSGSAYYVQSALAMAKYYSAYSVFIVESGNIDTPFCDKVLKLHSGHEVIAGSTRMKAGTATKKTLNFLSTTAMVLLGKVYGCYMVEVECINEKLVNRALKLLEILCNLNEHKAYALLEKNKFNLNKAIRSADMISKKM